MHTLSVFNVSKQINLISALSIRKKERKKERKKGRKKDFQANLG